MTITQRKLAHYDQLGLRNRGAEIINSAHLAGKTLQGSSMNSMNGILLQLSSLSIIASEMFNSLLSNARDTFSRVSTLSSRIESAKQKLVPLEDYAYNGALGQNMFTARGFALSEGASELLRRQDQQMIRRQRNMPVALLAQYDSQCSKTPDFGQQLNEHHERQNCAKDYSDPALFFEQWAKAEIARQERKAKERKDKRKKKNGMQQQKLEKIEVEKIHRFKDKFDKDGNVVRSASSGASPAPAMGTPPSGNGLSARDSELLGDMDDNDVPPPPPDDEEFGQAPIPASAPLPPSNAYHHHQQQQGMVNTPPSPYGYAPQPPTAAPPMQPTHQNYGYGAPMMSPVSSPSPPPMMAYSPPPPPPPMMSNSPPPPPPPAMVPSVSTGSSLQDQIAAAQLKKSAEAPKATSSKTMSLLDQIRDPNNKTLLRSAAQRTMPEKPAPVKTEELDVAAVLNNKFKSMLENDDDDDDDDDDEWD